MEVSYLAFALLKEPLRLDIDKLKRVASEMPEGAGADVASIKSVEKGFVMDIRDIRVGLHSMNEPIPPSEWIKHWGQRDNKDLSRLIDGHSAVLAVVCENAEGTDLGPMSPKIRTLAFMLLAHRIGKLGKPQAVYCGMNGRLAQWSEADAEIERLGTLILD